MKKLTKSLLTSLLVVGLVGCKSIPNVDDLTIKQTVKPSVKLHVTEEKEKEVLEMFYNKYKKNIKEASKSVITGLSKAYSISYKVKDDSFNIMIFDDGFGLLTKKGEEAKLIQFEDGVYEEIKKYFEDSEDKETTKLTKEDLTNMEESFDKDKFLNFFKGVE